MRRLRLLVTIAMVMLSSLGFEAHAQNSSVSSEYLIKAGFIYNFANLVQWPSNAFTQPDSPIVIGILGEDPSSEPSSTVCWQAKKSMVGHFWSNA